MTRPVLSGPRVALVPVPPPVARAVVAATDPAGPLAAHGLRPGPGWPHEDTADLLRPVAEHGADQAWLVALAGEVVGEVGWLSGPDEDGACEVGYGIAAPFRRRGLGAEAVRRLCDEVGRQPGVRQIVAEVLVGNEASLRLLQGLGFRPQGRHGSYVRMTLPA